MADFTALKTAIQNAIKQNGNEEITGNLLQEILLAIVTTLGDGSINDLITALGSEATTRGNADTTLQQNINAEAQARQLADSTLQGGINTAMQAINAINNAITNGCVYAGIATPSSTPASGKVFYLALTAGTYTNYGGLEVPQGINILKNNGSTWSLDAFVGIDDTPTPSSNNLVKSGGVFNDIMTNGSAFDLTAYNNGTTYADLNAALTALNALPAAFKKGGMSVKFVQSSDNKYVQYHYMGTAVTGSPNPFLDTANWQGVAVDSSLSISGAAADAKVAGDLMRALDADINALNTGSKKVTPKYGDYNGSVIIESTSRAYMYCSLSNIKAVSVANGFLFTPEVNNSGIGSSFSVLASWTSGTFELSGRTEKYLLVIIKKSDGSAISSNELTNIVTLTLRDSMSSIRATQREQFNANFVVDCLAADNNGICLNKATGNQNHNNIAWLKSEEGKSIGLIDAICNIPSTLNYAYAKFFVSNEDKTSYYYISITFTSTGETIDIYQWYNNALQSRIAQIRGTVVVSDFTSINVKLLYDNGGLFIYINDNLACYTDVVQVNGNVQMGVAWANTNSKVYYNFRCKERPKKYVHVSVDDVRNCLKDIIDNSSTYSSIFENAFFAKLKSWHTSYGAVFTLNVFNYFDDASTIDLLSNVPTKYKSEFIDVSAWLKFGVHSPSSIDYYATFTDADVVSTYTSMINNIIRFAGWQSVDPIARFGYFSINNSAILALKNANVGFMGCLTSDDNRVSDCGLDSTGKTIVQTYGEYYDFAHNVVYIKSMPRLDDFDLSTNIANFKGRFTHLKWSRYLEVFFHEGTASDSYEDMETLLPLIRSLGLDFDYGINNILL